jgi:CRP-like cAMP-binding protein
VEVATVGSDGAVGLAIILEDDTTVHSARVQIAGSAVRIGARALEAAFHDHPTLRRSLLRWTHHMMADISHAVVCHRFHQVLERLCSYLLRTADRLDVDRFSLTHQALADALGVSRKTVSLAAIAVLSTGAIQYRRGRIVIADRQRLMRSACECYVPPAHSGLERTPVSAWRVTGQ